MNKISLDRFKKLADLYWVIEGTLKVSPLGGGYIMFKFGLADDFNRIWGQGSFQWDNQLLWLIKWHPNFSIEKQNQSNALVWVKFPGLSLEYQGPRLLMALGRVIGAPVHIDYTTATRDSGYYAMVLIDIDESKEHRNIFGWRLRTQISCFGEEQKQRSYCSSVIPIETLVMCYRSVNSKRTWRKEK